MHRTITNKILKLCYIPDCDKPARHVGLCNTHHSRLWRCGSATANVRAHRRHGLRNTPEYGIWKNMKVRCYNKNFKDYIYYGGRGIGVCDGWRNDFAAFYQDIGPRPSDNHILDRENSDGHYSCGKCSECIRNGWPMNVRWVTATISAVNRRKQPSASGLRGVYLQTYGKYRWGVMIGINHQLYWFGKYPSKEEAAWIYDYVMVQLYGKEAKQNLNAIII
jgi:hypothetical protein